MRRRAGPLLFAAVLLASLLAAVPAATAHGDEHDGPGFPHVNPRSFDLAEGANASVHIAYTLNSPAFHAGWAFVLNAAVTGGSATPTAELVQNGTVVGSWEITPGGQTRHLWGAFAETGEAELRFSNPGPGPVNLTVFYDMSCACAGKPIPPEVADGTVVFNVDIRAGDTWRATFPEPNVHRLNVWLATRTDDRSVWPDDFEVLQESRDPIEQDGGRFHVFEWTAEETGTYYFVMQSVAIDESLYEDPNVAATVYVVPSFREVTGEDDGGTGPAGPATPLGVEVVAAALVLGAVAAAGRRRRR